MNSIKIVVGTSSQLEVRSEDTYINITAKVEMLFGENVKSNVDETDEQSRYIKLYDWRQLLFSKLYIYQYLVIWMYFR